MQSDRQLLRLYNQYNNKYFNGELSEKVEIVWEPYPKCDGVICPIFEISDGIFSIKIDPALKGSPCYARVVLLHEMVHASIWRAHPKHKHGKLFQDRMLKLAQDGAFRNLW